MISLATDLKQIVLFYNSNQKNHRETLAYAASTCKKVLSIDVSKVKVAGTAWTEIADALQLRAGDLLHTDHSSYAKKYGEHKDINCNAAIKTLQKDPDMLIFPIAIQGEKAMELKLDSEMSVFFDVDTSSIRIT
jgi:arsenate reductase-like glutaredoxin family protein